MKIKKGFIIALGVVIITVCFLIVIVLNGINKTVTLSKGTIGHETVKTFLNHLPESQNPVALGGFHDDLIYTYRSTDDGVEYYSTEDNTIHMIYESDAAAISCNEMYNGNIIICEFYAENQMSFTVKQIGESMEETLFQADCKNMPIVNLIGDSIIINYEVYHDGMVEQPLLLYNLENGKMTAIGNYTYQIDAKGACSGELLQSADGFDDGVIIEIIQFDNEIMNLDRSGKPKLFYYDFTTGNMEELPITLPRKLLYAGGDMPCIVTSDYASERPLEETGTIYSLENGQYVSMAIPGIESGNDIRSASRITDTIIAVQTLEHIYFIDIDKKIYEIIDSGGSLKVNHKSAGFINQNNELCMYYFN